MRKNTGDMIRLVSMTAACGLLLAAAAVQAKDDYPSPMTVCVRGAGEGGFVTGDVADSVKDVQKKLDGRKVVRLVDSPQAADLVLTVVGRGNAETGRTIYRSHSSHHSYRSSSTKETVKVVRAVLASGSYKLDMYGVDDVWWGSAANDLADKVEKWIKGNYDQLLGRRDKKDAAFSNAGIDADEGDKEPAASGSKKDADIKMGMTEKEVVDLLGAPAKKVGFGRKTQWTYKNMTIVFEGGRVTDVKF
jgi:hypothetical protein